MGFRVGDETWAMNERQGQAILALQADYPEPMIVGWRVTRGGAVVGHIFRSVEDDEAARPCGEFSICTTGVVRWISRPSRVPAQEPQ